MTIKEIKKIRATVLPTEQEYFDAHSVEMVDALLGEVDRRGHVIKDVEQSYFRLVDKYNDRADQLLSYQTKLTIATEALEKIVSATTQRITTARYIARTALERIKE